MARIVAFLLIFLLGFPLFAEWLPRDPVPKDSRFFALSITGKGTKEAKSFIYNRINYEVAFQDYILAWSRRDSDYVIRGSIHSVIDDSEFGELPASGKSEPKIKKTGSGREFLSWEVRDTAFFYDTSSNRNALPGFYEEEFVLILQLLDSRTNKVLDEGRMVFNKLNEDAEYGIALIMHDFFMGRKAAESDVDYIAAVILKGEDKSEPEPEPELEPFNPEEARKNAFFRESANYRFSDDWRDKLIYFEYSILWAPRENFITNEINYLNLGYNLSFEMQVVSFMALELGAQFVQETSGGEEYRDLLGEFPIMALKFVFKPFRRIMIEVYGGLSISYISLLETVTPSYSSLFAGLELCFNTKGGTLVLDPRYSVDRDLTNFGPGLDHKRRLLQLGVGYKIGFINKLVKR